MKRKFTFLIAVAFMLLTMMATTGTMWGQTRAEGDTHDFSQSLSQLLNNNASIASIEIAQQSYSVKKVTISYRYNKTLANAVTMEVSVNGTSWGSEYSVGTGSNYTTVDFEGTSTTGAVVITFTNNTGDGTGHGTFYVDNVTLTEGVSGGGTTYTVTYHANGGTGDNIEDVYNEGSDVTVRAANTFTYAGHAFTKWNTVAGGTGTDYNPEDVIENISADIDLYAQWEESDETIDVLNYAFTGISGTSYSAWSGKTGASGAVYAGRSGGDHNSIQLNSSSPNGIVSTTSGGKFTKVVVTWNSSTSNNRSVQIYGKNTAYEGSADLYDNDKKGTLIGSIVKGTSTELTISNDYNYIGIKNPGSAIYMDEVKITWVPDTDPAVATTVTIDATNLTNTDVYTSTEAGSLSATVHAGETLIDGASITWESSNTDAATIDENGVVTLVAAGQTTITASYAGVANTYKPSSATYNLTVINSNVPGSQNHPYTVAQARAAIDAGTGITGVYVTGIISQVDSYNSSYHSITYWISGDGTTTSDQLEVYSGKGLNNTNFSSIDDVAVGATVVVYGTLKKYNEVYEFDYNNYLTSYTAPVVTVEAPTFSPAAGTYDEAQSVTLSCTTEGSTIYYTTNGTEPTNESTQYTDAINVESTTTIKAIAYVGDDYSNVATATYTITSLNNISDITEVGTAYSVKGTVVAINNKGLIIGDGTGYVYYYKNGSVDQSIGDIIKISGNTVTYGQIIQFTSATPNTATVTEATNSNYNGTPEATTITAVPDFSEGYHLSTYLEFAGALSKSNSNYFITLGEEQIQISYPTSAQSEALTDLDGKTVHVKGYFSGINSNSKFTVMLESAEEVLVPSITLTPSVINEAPAAGGSGDITVTCANMGENPVLSIEFCDANGDPAEYDWISAVFNDTYTKITGTFTENTTTEPRTAHLKVYGTVPNSTTIVYSDIFSITQLAPAGPNIVFETASMSLIAGGESDRKLSFDYSGLGSTPTFTINYYEQDGETEATYDWLTASIDENDKLNITAGANTGEARSAYLKVYGVKNENVHAESNLVTITQAEYVDPTQDIVDILNLEFTGVSGTSYTGWSGKTGTSGAVYAGNSAGDHNSIQLRTNNNNSGIITTTSGGKVTKVEVTWNGYTSSGRKIDIYGKNTAYETASDLYGDNQGTKLGTIEYDNNTALIITDDYEFIGIRSTSGALYLDEIKITWSTGPAVPSITVAPAEINIDANENIEELGVTVANISSINVDNFNVDYCNSDGTEIEGDKPDIIDDYVFTANQQDEGYTLTITFKANTGDARTAYFNVIYTSGENDNVHSNVITVNQEAYVAPVATITVNPAEINIDANENIEELGVTVANISSIDLASFNIDYCNSDGSEIEGDKPDIIDDYEFTANTPEEGYTLTITFKANEGDARTAYFKVKYELGENDYVYSNVVAVNQESTEVVGVTYELVTSNNDIVSGAHYYIAGVNNLNAWFAMGQQKTNNRQAESVTVSNNTINQTDNVHEVIISSYNDDFYSIFDEASGTSNGYLYAAGGTSNNYLKTYDNYDERGQWTISIDEETHVATITANITGRNIMRYNSGSDVFSCYGSGQQPIYLFKKVDNNPSITADDVEIEHNETSGSIIYTINNYVEGTMVATTTADWISDFEYDQVEELGSVDFTATTNTSYESRSATVTLTYTYGDPIATTTKNVTVTQTGAPIPTYIVSFDVDGGEFVPNDVFTDEIVEIEAGTYTLPSAIKDGYIFDGWNDGDQIYAAGEEYTVSAAVEFYATYTELQHFTIHFFVNGEADNDMPVVQGNSVELPLTSTLTPDGFSIYGWALENSTTAVENPYTPTGDVTLYALLQMPVTEYYEKVTADLTDWSGEYLIVYTTGNLAFDGSLTTLDASGNTIAVSISDNKINANATIDASKFTIAAYDGGYSIKSASNKYIGNGSNSNSLTASDSELKNTISYNNGDIDIVGTGGAYLRYNSASDQARFRYYKSSSYSSQQPIQLYRKVSETPVVFNNVTVYDDPLVPEPVMDDPIPETTCVVVGEGITLTLNNVNNGTAANLIVRDGGQLIHTEPVNATVQKSVAGASSWGSKGVDGWYLIASPVNGASTSSVTIGQYDLFVYNEPNAYWWVASGHGINTFSHGQGFLYANAASVDLNFAGEMVGTETSVSVDLSYTSSVSDDVKGFNLVGNPFSRNLEEGDVMWNTETNIAYLTMNPARTDFVTVNISDRPIKPGEGFFFQADGEGQQLVFNPTTSKGGNGYIKIVAGNENGSDNAYINIANGNTIRKFNIDNGTKVYVMEDNGDDYAAARVEELAGSMLVNFKAAEDGEYTITVNAKNIEAHTMMLFDDFTGETIDLLETPSYTFTASVNDSETRFKLIFDFNTYTGIGENYTNGNFAYQAGDEILVSGEGTLQVFDVMGRFVASFEVNGSKRISTSLFNTGVYIFKMTGEKNMTQKIVVR